MSEPGGSEEIDRIGPDDWPVIIGVEGPYVTIGMPGESWLLDAADRDRFAKAWAEAERRAGAHGAHEAHEAAAGDTCWHCRKPIVRCDSVPYHIGCGPGHGWIHTNPEQWGHSCEPRSGHPYARPDAPSSGPSQ